MAAGIESACNVGDLGSIPGLGRSPGEGNDYPLKYSGLENSMNYSTGLQRVGHDWATFTFTIRREVASTEPEEKKLCEDRGREWGDAATSQGMSEATRSCQKRRILFQSFHRAVAVLASQFWTSSIQNYKRTHFCCLSPSHFWSSATEALETNTERFSRGFSVGHPARHQPPPSTSAQCF